MHWLDKLPYVFLVPLALAIGILPLDAEPHLIEKLRMLRAGALQRPIDILDLLFHGTPAALLMAKIARDGFRLGSNEPGGK